MSKVIMSKVIISIVVVPLSHPVAQTEFLKSLLVIVGSRKTALFHHADTLSPCTNFKCMCNRTSCLK